MWDDSPASGPCRHTLRASCLTMTNLRPVVRGPGFAWFTHDSAVSQPRVTQRSWDATPAPSALCCPLLRLQGKSRGGDKIATNHIAPQQYSRIGSLLSSAVNF